MVSVHFGTLDTNTRVSGVVKEETPHVGGRVRRTWVEGGAVVVKNDRFGVQRVPGVRLSCAFLRL